MPFDVSQYLALRPYAYHVTASENLPLLRNRRRVYPAAELLKLGNRLDLLRERREAHVPLSFDDHIILLKGQRPLIEKNADLAEGWDFGDFVEYLNGHVFFWPGTDTGAIGPGRRLLEHYASEGPAILRVPTWRLFDVNSTVTASILRVQFRGTTAAERQPCSTRTRSLHVGTPVLAASERGGRTRVSRGNYAPRGDRNLQRCRVDACVRVVNLVKYDQAGDRP